MNTKKFIQILAVSATALITACEEELTSFDCETPITVTSQVSETTRAGYESSNYQNLPTNFVMDINQEGENYDYSLVEMTHQPNSYTYNAPADVLLLWKGNGEHSRASVKAMTIPNGLSAIDPTNAMPINISTDQTTDANVKASDLLGAKSGDGINIVGNNIEIEFRHLMSKFHVNYKTASSNITVQSITLNNICVKGGYSYNNMNYDDNISLGYGNIQMFHNSTDKTAEAIFYPYTPTQTSTPSLIISIKDRYNRNRNLTCNLEDIKSFVGGNKYTLDINITGTSVNLAKISIEGWTSYDPMEVIRNKKILWIGTSIPSNHPDFGQSESYPTLIERATGCEIINNGIAGSLVSYYPLQTSWTADQWESPNNLKVNEAEAYALSATKAEIANKYRTILTNLANQKPENVRNSYTNAINNHIARLQQYSYEELIIPYITGNNPCDVVVIDHGYNDMEMIPMDIMFGQGKDFDGALNFLETIATTPSSYTITDTYKNYFGPTHGVSDRMTYIAAMNYVIKKCKEANPNVQIIIGNYFATRTPFYRDNNINGDNFAYVCDCFVKTNEAIARMNDLEIVNVYKFTGLDADNVNHRFYNQVFYGLCPDGVHPGSDPTSSLNRIIANIYIEEFKKIFNK